MKDLGSILQQAQKMQEQMKAVQEALAKKTAEGSSGGGMVKVVVNGKQHVLSLTIDPQMWTLKDPQMLQDLIVSATNEAIRNSQELAAQEMKGKMTESLGPFGSLLNMLS